MAKQYPNRSDLRNPSGKIATKAAPGQTYGKAGQQLSAQKAVPMGAPSAPQPQMPSARQPGSAGPLTRPTERPNEPVTSGASFGPGPTPTSAMMVPRRNDPVLDELRAIYMQFPTDELADMLDSYVREGY